MDNLLEIVRSEALIAAAIKAEDPLELSPDHPIVITLADAARLVSMAESGLSYCPEPLTRSAIVRVLYLIDEALHAEDPQQVGLSGALMRRVFKR